MFLLDGVTTRRRYSPYTEEGEGIRDKDRHKYLVGSFAMLAGVSLQVFQTGDLISGDLPARYGEVCDGR